MNKYILLLALLLSACQEQNPEPQPEPTPIPEPEPSPTDPKYVRPLPKPIPDWAKVPEVDNPLYVCSIDGNDNYPGTQDQPKKSFEQAVIDNWTSRNQSNRDILLCRGGKWEVKDLIRIVSKNLDTNDYTYIGAYGDESLLRPYLKNDNGFFFENAKWFYFHNLELEGKGYDSNSGEGFTLWDKVDHIVINNVKIHEYRLGINASEGRSQIVEDGGEARNTHLAVINSEGYWNRVGFYFGGFTNNTFIHNNKAAFNGGYGGAHNYYLAGEWKTKTEDYVFQLNLSLDAAPRNGKHGGKCSRGAVVAHGYIKGLYFVDNTIIEKKGNSEGGCWGAPIDWGRGPEWGEENFPNLTYTGNHAEYTGNLLFGLTNADEALVGWNTGIVDATQQGVGFAAPNKLVNHPMHDEATAIKTLKVVHNNFHIEGAVKYNASGIRINNGIEAETEHNIVTYDTLQKGIVCYEWQDKNNQVTRQVTGDTIEGSSYETNRCFFSAEPTFK